MYNISHATHTAVNQIIHSRVLLTIFMKQLELYVYAMVQRGATVSYQGGGSNQPSAIVVHGFDQITGWPDNKK